MIVRDWIIPVAGSAPVDTRPPGISMYPTPGADHAYRDAVVKISFSQPVRGVDARTFTLTDSQGRTVAASVDQIGDGTWALFPNQVVLDAGASYTARLARGICDAAGRCTATDIVWSFRISPEGAPGSGDTGVPTGFAAPLAGQAIPHVSWNRPASESAERVRSRAVR